MQQEIERKKVRLLPFFYCTSGTRQGISAHKVLCIAAIRGKLERIAAKAEAHLQ